MLFSIPQLNITFLLNSSAWNLVSSYSQQGLTMLVNVTQSCKISKTLFSHLLSYNNNERKPHSSVSELRFTFSPESNGINSKLGPKLNLMVNAQSNSYYTGLNSIKLLQQLTYAEPGWIIAARLSSSNSAEVTQILNTACLDKDHYCILEGNYLKQLIVLCLQEGTVPFILQFEFWYYLFLIFPFLGFLLWISWILT